MHLPRYPLALAAGLVLTATAGFPLSAQASPAPPGQAMEPEAGASVQEVSPVHVTLIGSVGYTVQPGDYLSGISGRLCGTPADYLALAYNNHVADPDLIYPGQVIRAACQAAASALSGAYRTRRHADQAQVSAGHVVAESVADAPQVSARGTFGCAALEALWTEAGGSPGDAELAASVARAESGGNPDAVSPTDDYGLWQINASHGPEEATLSPQGNARAAVAISDGGADWAPWTTYRTGAYRGLC